MIKYNLDKLVKVELNDFNSSQWYSYKKEKKFLGLRIQKEGVYENVDGEYLGKKPIENHTVIDDDIYENPVVILHYQAGHSKTYYFNNFDDAKKFSDDITLTGKWQV
jgi:hypothetical protein